MEIASAYLRKIKSSANNMIFVLMFLYLIGIFYYGLSCVILGVVGVLTAVIFDFFMSMMRGRKWDRSDNTSICIALTLVALLPASAPLWMPVMGVIVALGIAKYPFGGIGSYVVNPVALAYSFLVLNFSDIILKYPVPFQKVAILQEAGVELAYSPASALKNMGVPAASWLDLILGNMAGPIGAGCALVVIGCGVFLYLQKAIDYRIPVAFLATVAVFALIFPRVQVGRGMSIFYELFTGSTIFCAVFLASDYTINPRRFLGKIVYGVLLGILTMLCKYFGAFDIGFCFAMILSDAAVPFIDRIMPMCRFDQNYAEVKLSEK